MVKAIAIAVVIFSIILLPVFCYCMNDFHNPDLESKTTQGQIVAVDTSYLNIVVKMATYHDEITINVPHKTTIIKDNANASLSDLEPGDNVTVVYYNDSPGPLKALNITVTS